MDSKKLLKTLTLGQGSILVPHIDAYQERGKFPAKRTFVLNHWEGSSNHFKPSTDCLTPVDVLWAEKKGLAPDKKISASLRRTFDIGTLWHEYIGALLLDMGFVAPEGIEMRVKTDVESEFGSATVSGLADLVGVEIPGHGKWLIDMKTMRKDDFAYGLKADKQRQYNAQVNVYGDLLGYDQMMILAIEKDSPHRLREFIVRKDTDTVNEIYRRWTYVAKCLREDKEPDPNDL